VAVLLYVLHRITVAQPPSYFRVVFGKHLDQSSSPTSASNDRYAHWGSFYAPSALAYDAFEEFIHVIFIRLRRKRTNLF
jgi:hypothetical protein